MTLCQGHPAGPNDPMGETVYCDGSCRPEQPKRRAAFIALMEADGWKPTDYDEGEEEDPRPYVAGEEPLGRFVCVTMNWSSHGSEKLFYLPTFDDLILATSRAEEYDRDDLFEEIPVKVVDLDTGVAWYAKPTYAWESRGGIAVSLQAGDSS